ncbi:hypothetical protein [Arenibaculum sp.]|uniref:hypothetical protein n=1 Tax=Arenibaculum sp. TaxID=2865862 RepID=UPI002E0F1757|nr:hypothetical protein [Arenibaculum sp.]
MTAIPCIPNACLRYAVAAAAASLMIALAAAPARAESIACQTVNGVTHCLEGNGSISCVTINGKSSCRIERFPPGSAKPDEDATVPVEDGHEEARDDGREEGGDRD